MSKFTVGPVADPVTIVITEESVMIHGRGLLIVKHNKGDWMSTSEVDNGNDWATPVMEQICIGAEKGAGVLAHNLGFQWNESEGIWQYIPQSLRIGDKPFTSPPQVPTTQDAVDKIQRVLVEQWNPYMSLDLTIGEVSAYKNVLEWLGLEDEE